MDDRQLAFSGTGHLNGVRPIGQALMRFEVALQEAFKREVHDLTYGNLKSKLTVRLGQDQEFREETVVQYIVEDALTFPRINHALYRVQSCAFLILAEQALKLGDEAAAWHFLSEG